MGQQSNNPTREYALKSAALKSDSLMWPLVSISTHILCPAQEGSVEVPEVRFALSSENFLQLQRAVSPLTHSEDFGMDLYEQVLRFIS